MLCGWQKGLFEVIQATYTVCSSHNRLSELLQASFMKTKRTLVMNKPPTRSAESNTDYPKLCKLLTKSTLRTSTSLPHFLWNSKRIFRSSTSLLCSLPKSKRTLRSYTIFLCSQNWLFEPLQASYIIYGSQNGLSVRLQATYKLYVTSKSLLHALR